MKQVLLLLFSFFLLTGVLNAASYTVTISGFSYTPPTLTVNVGDVVTIEASGFHPLVQVSASSWDANDATPLSGGFSSSVTYNLTITAAMAGTTIYYACSNHAASGMKGMIDVNVISNIRENQAHDYNFTIYPNPVAADAWLNVSIKKAGKISFSMYDLKGRLVTRFTDINLQAGTITIPFHTAPLQKGLYVLQMRTSQGLLKKQIFIQ